MKSLTIRIIRGSLMHIRTFPIISGIEKIINILAILFIDTALQMIYSLIHNYYIFASLSVTIQLESIFFSLITCGPIIYFLTIRLLNSNASPNSIIKDLILATLIVLPGGFLLALSSINTWLILSSFSAALWITYTVITYIRFLKASIGYLIVFMILILYPIYFLWIVSNVAIDALLVILPLIHLLIVIIISFRILETKSTY